MSSKKTILIKTELREVKTKKDYNPYINDFPLSTRSSVHHEVASTTKQEIEYDAKHFGEGVHFVWEF